MGRGHKGWFTPWTVKSDHRRWAFFRVLIFLKDQCTKSLGPSLGVNRMWTKSECVGFFNVCPKKGDFKSKKKVQV